MDNLHKRNKERGKIQILCFFLSTILCVNDDSQALGSHSRFPPHLLLAVAALPLPIVVLAIPIKVLFIIIFASTATINAMSCNVLLYDIKVISIEKF